MSLDAWLKHVREGLKEAIAEEVASLRRDGHPIVISRGGKIVVLRPGKRKAKTAAPRRRARRGRKK